MRGEKLSIVVDTNVFVAALFNPGSHAARILDAIRAGRLRLIWDRRTLRETRAILEKIPPIDWVTVKDLFDDSSGFDEPTHPERFQSIPDPDDRAFAALAHRAGAILISQDDHLLAHPERLDILVLTPHELAQEGWLTAIPDLEKRAENDED